MYYCKIIKNFPIFFFVIVFIFSPLTIFAEAKDTINNGNVSVEKAKDSIFNKVPEKLTLSIKKLIGSIENQRKNYNTYAEKEIAKIKDLTNEQKPKETENSNSTFTNPPLGSSEEVFRQVKYYLFWILAFITSHQILFWGILFVLFFAVIRTILRIIF